MEQCSPFLERLITGVDNGFWGDVKKFEVREGTTKSKGKPAIAVQGSEATATASTSDDACNTAARGELR